VTGPDGATGGPILVGVDFSPGSEAALCWAAEASIAFDRPVLVVHVAHDPAEAPGYYATRGLEGIERAAQDMMARFMADARERLPCLSQVRQLDAIVVVGLPETRILEVAAREGASLIVMGAQGRTALADVLLGSKVERVTRLSPIPVTIAKTADAKEGGPDGEPQGEPA
jgi:nucleotide-binding universal stress UspA family protein